MYFISKGQVEIHCQKDAPTVTLKEGDKFGEVCCSLVTLRVDLIPISVPYIGSKGIHHGYVRGLVQIPCGKINVIMVLVHDVCNEGLG